jgi:hypothetical protein
MGIDDLSDAFGEAWSSEPGDTDPNRNFPKPLDGMQECSAALA